MCVLICVCVCVCVCACVCVCVRAYVCRVSGHEEEEVVLQRAGLPEEETLPPLRCLRLLVLEAAQQDALGLSGWPACLCLCVCLSLCPSVR